MSERLAFILSLDADGAIRGFQKVGATADKELGKADQRLDKIAGNMTKFGAGAVAASGVAAVGLFKFAQASQEAQLSELKLQNTLANMPKLAGATADEFIDLAEAIQKKTAADADQIVEAQAMLGTFSTTADEIKGLTPLVVDFSRKFGVDLTTAAIQVGKAMDGQIGALKRNGVSIDENLYKTDRYAAVTQALRDQVGGFAEQEGKTMAGQLASLKNQLGDIQEGVGVGVVDAFSDMSGAVFGAVDAIGGLNEQTLAGAGQFATYATAALGVVGSLSFVGGQAIKMKDRFTTLGDDGSRSMNKLGKASAGLGAIMVAGGVIAAAYELGEAFDSSTRFAEKFANGTSTVSLALSRLNGIMDANNAAHEAFTANAPESTKAYQAEFVAVKNLDEAHQDLTKILETGNIVAGQRYVEAMDQAGLSTEEAKLQVEAATGAAKQYKADMEQTAEIIDGVAESTEDATDALGEMHDAMRDSFDTRAAYETSVKDTAEALDGMKWAAYNAYTTVDDKSTLIDEAAVAQDEYKLSVDDAAEAVRNQADRAVENAAKIAEANGQTLTATEKNALWREELVKVAGQLEPGSPLRKRLVEYLADLNRVPGELKTKITVDLPDLRNRAVGGAGLSGYRAAGGPVSAGGAYVVGENGPEVLQMGSSGGNVVPNHALGAATFNFNFSGPVGNERQMQEWVMSALEAAKRSGYTIPSSN